MIQERPTAIVTGAGSGLGRALALDLDANGYAVIVADVNVNAAEETLRQMSENNTSEACELDVTSAEGLCEFENAYKDRPIDVLVNNAGLQHVAPIEAFPIEIWKNLINVMLVGSAAMIKIVLPGMRRRSFGRIVNIGSVHSCVASPFKSAYVAAKHGLLGLAKTVALETHDVDITINTICPAYIQTPLVEAQIASQALAHGVPPEEVVNKIFLEPMPKRAFITTEEVAATLRFLLSSHARNITGQTIVIDGGWTIR